MDEHEQCKQEAAEAAARISALEAQVAVLGSDGNAARKRVRELNEEVAGLKTQVARLREALEFYGREWESDFVVTYATEDLLEDGGAKARAALSSTAAPEPETPPAIIDENATADDALRAVYDAYKDNQARATAPAWVPTHRHYKGGLYRELMRVEREGDAEKMVVYEAEDGRRWVRPAAEFDSTVTVPLPRDLADGKREYVRRYAPLIAAQEPADPPWITWEGGEGVPVNAPVWARRRDETEELVEHPENRCWEHLGLPSDIVAYRLVREGGHGG